MWKMRQSLSPDKAFKAALLKKLNTRLDAAYNVKYVWYQTVWFKHAAGFAVVIFVVTSLGTGAYAYSSPQVTEGSVLYSIKKNLENIEGKVKITPEAKARFYLKTIERREKEKDVLEKENVELKNIEKVNQTIEKTEDKLFEEANKIVEKLELEGEDKDDEDVKLRQEVKARVRARLQKIEAKRLDRMIDIKNKNDLKNEEEGIVKLRAEIKVRAEIRAEEKDEMLEEQEERQETQIENRLQNLKSRIELLNRY